MKQWSRFIFIVLTVFSFKLYAADSEQNPAEEQLAAPTILDAVRLLDSSGPISGIKLLENRFRIDYAVDELVLIFFRKYGSAPVILIRPDGSKLYAATIGPNEGNWFDDNTYDMIRLIKPMPGPWQVVGKLVDGSKLMVVSDISLEADEVPPIVFSGETLKLGARLRNNGKPIDYRGFSNVVSLDITFVSTNNSKYENFGAESLKIATFTDDGKNFDERPKDGEFTGEHKFALPSGEWLPVMYLDLGLFNRESTLAPVFVESTPFKISVETTSIAGEFHLFKIEPNTEKIKFDTFVFNGKAYFPNGAIEQFVLRPEDILEDKPKLQSYLLMNYIEGAHRVELSAFGKNSNDRDVMLSIPSFSFTSEPPPPPEPTAEELAALEAERLAIIAAEEAAEVLRLQKIQDEHEQFVVSMVILANIIIIIVVILWIRAFVFKKSVNPFKNLTILKRFKKAKGGKENKEEDKKPTEGDDIIDLSLPDDS